MTQSKIFISTIVFLATLLFCFDHSHAAGESNTHAIHWEMDVDLDIESMIHLFREDWQAFYLKVEADSTSNVKSRLGVINDLIKSEKWTPSESRLISGDLQFWNNFSIDGRTFERFDKSTPKQMITSYLKFIREREASNATSIDDSEREFWTLPDPSTSGKNAWIRHRDILIRTNQIDIRNSWVWEIKNDEYTESNLVDELRSVWVPCEYQGRSDWTSRQGKLLVAKGKPSIIIIKDKTNTWRFVPESICLMSDSELSELDYSTAVAVSRLLPRYITGKIDVVRPNWIYVDAFCAARGKDCITLLENISTRGISPVDRERAKMYIDNFSNKRNQYYDRTTIVSTIIAGANCDATPAGSIPDLARLFPFCLPFDTMDGLKNEITTADLEKFRKLSLEEISKLKVRIASVASELNSDRILLRKTFRGSHPSVRILLDRVPQFELEQDIFGLWHFTFGSPSS